MLRPEAHAIALQQEQEWLNPIKNNRDQNSGEQFWRVSRGRAEAIAQLKSGQFYASEVAENLAQIIG